MASAADDEPRQRRKAEMTMLMMAHTGSSSSSGSIVGPRRRRQHPPMRCPLLFTILPLILLPLLLFNVVEAMPLQLKIRHGEKECFLESLTAGYVFGLCWAGRAGHS
jgi:hypothetical protein